MSIMRLMAASFAAVVVGVASISFAQGQPGTAESTSMWDIAQQKRNVHRFSTLFDARFVGEQLTKDGAIEAAIAWCRKNGVTKVYVESFRDGYEASHEALVRARDAFRTAGIEASGCVTTTVVGKRSSGWDVVCCYTDQPTQDRLQTIFEHAAAAFDEIMIDDFLFTDCKCRECDAAREARTVSIGDRTYAVAGDAWEDYHCELMVRLSRDRILAPARKVNPKAKLIIKYPQWYDNFHNNGYEIVRQTQDFDWIWVGTATRDYDDKQWGGTPQYEAYFIMRWLGGVGGAKCGGGWYDSLGTTERTYVEQARQTVLGGARESMLFNYAILQRGTHARGVEALRPSIPELLDVAEQVAKRPIVGVAAYKPANSHPEDEARVFDFVGMMGVPLVPCHEFPADATAAFFSVHAMKDAELPEKLAAFIASGRPVLVTDGLARRLEGKVDLAKPNVQVLSVKGDPKSLLTWSRQQLDAMRAPLLRPLGVAFGAPNRVALYLFTDGSWVVENFTDEAVTVQLGGEPHNVAARGWAYRWK